MTTKRRPKGGIPLILDMVSDVKTLKVQSYSPAHGTVKWRDTDFPKTLSLVLKTM